MGIYAKTTEGWQEIGAGAAGADLVGGVAGWAAIESVTGTASLDDLKTAGIAPATATADDDCPGTYNIVGDDGVVYRVAVWTDTTPNSGSFEVPSQGLFEALLVGGGGRAAGATGGGCVRGLFVGKPGTNNILVGEGGAGTPAVAEWTIFGKPSTITNSEFGYSSGAGIHSQSVYGPEVGGAFPGTFISDITGVSLHYSGVQGRANVVYAPGRGAGGDSGSTAGTSGIVVVRAPKDAANNPKPDAPVAWGDFTTNGDEQASGTYGPDAQGRTWKWAEWNVANDYTVNLTGGMYRVLCVGGGGGGVDNNDRTKQGQPGLVMEGMWEFDAGPTPVKVGKAGLSSQTTTNGGGGRPSSIGTYGLQGISSWGSCMTGRGAPADDNTQGHNSSITGVLKEFAPGALGGPLRPGRGGFDGDQTDGCVIIATVTNEQSDWNPPGALPGLGGWATIKAVTGMPNRYAYNDGPGGVGGFDWVAFEWATDGSVKTSDGLMDALIVSSGANQLGNGNGGRLKDGLRHFTGTTHTVKVGPWNMNESALGVYGSGLARSAASNENSGAGGTKAEPTLAYKSSITGTERLYAGGIYTGSYGDPKMGGVVIVRVPAAQAAGVDPTTYNDITTFDLAKEAAKTEIKEAVKDKRKKR